MPDDRDQMARLGDIVDFLMARAAKLRSSETTYEMAVKDAAAYLLTEWRRHAQEL